MRFSVILAGLVLAFTVVSDAGAQNRDIRTLRLPATEVSFKADDFSAVDVGELSLGSYQTYHYAGFEIALGAAVPKNGEEPSYYLTVMAPRLKAPGRILSVAARGGIRLEEIANDAGPVNCSRYSCRHDAFGVFALPAEMLGSLRGGLTADVRISTSCGSECDVVLPIYPVQIDAIDEWVASRVSTEPSPREPADE